MTSRRVEITLDEATWDRLETARLREPRASFVKRALESALNTAASGVTASESRVGSASTRASRKVVVREVDFDESYTKPTRAPKADPTAPRTMTEAAIRATLPPGVKTARELAMERQRKLNEKKT